MAHKALNRLAERETVAVAIPGDINTIAAVLEPYGVTVTAYKVADTPTSLAR